MDDLFREVHLSLGTPAASTVWVTWATETNFTSHVQWGTSFEQVVGGRGTVAVGAPGFRYSHTDSQNEPEFEGGVYLSPFLHHVELAGLPTDGGEVFYRIGGRALNDTNDTNDRVRWSSVTSSFRTSPAAGATDSLFLSVVGDLGQTEFSNHTMHRLFEAGKEPAFLMLVGDVSYADGMGSRWDSWGNMMQRYLRYLPLVTFPGNHEVEPDEATGETFKHYRNRFKNPQVAPEVVGPGTINDWNEYDFNLTYDFGSSYFSFDLGPVHFVCLDTYAQAHNTSVQVAWLESDLAAVDRSTTPWILVFAHGPFYNSNVVHQNEVATDTLRTAVEPLLRQYDVAALFAGHVHAYERTHGVYKGSRDDCRGTTYVTIGDGGNREGLYDTWQEPAAEWVDFRNGSKYGRGDLLVANDTHLHWQWIPSNAVDDDPQDHAWITNPHTVTACRATSGDDPTFAPTPAPTPSSTVERGPESEDQDTPARASTSIKEALVIAGSSAAALCILACGCLLVARRRKPKEDSQGLFSSSVDWFDWEDEGVDEGEWVSASGDMSSRWQRGGYADIRNPAQSVELV